MATQLKDFATALVAVIEPETPALTVAQLMRQHHVGALVLELMAEGLDPAVFTAGDIMAVATPDMDVRKKTTCAAW